MALAFLTFLCRHEHHAVCTTAAIDCGSRGILEDFGAGNVGRTQEVDIVAVDNETAVLFAYIESERKIIPRRIRLPTTKARSESFG